MEVMGTMQNGKMVIEIQPRVSFGMRFKLIEFACREGNGSLKPGGVKAYCSECQFKFKRDGCLFAPSRRVEVDEKLSESRRQAGRRKAAAARAEGVNSAGEPLTESCWNCEVLRQVEGGYVCKMEPDGKPVSRATANRTRTVAKTGCGLFGMRYEVDIPFLEDEIASSLCSSQ